MFGLALLLGIGGAVFLALLVGQCYWTLTHPPRRTYAWAVARSKPGDPSELDEPRAFERWSVGACGVWDIEGDREDGPVVIVTHGWGDSRIGVLSRLGALTARACRVIVWDLPGHGESPGTCSLGVREVGLLRELIGRVKDERVVLYGWSLGAGVSIAAADERVAGVIAEAPYRMPITPARNVMRRNHFPYRVNLPIAMWLAGMRAGVGPGWRGFDRAEAAKGLGCPLLVVHGSEDEICPVGDGRAIAAAGELVVIEGAGHNDLWSEAFAARSGSVVEGFLGRLGA